MDVTVTRFDIAEVEARMRELLADGPMQLEELRRRVTPANESPDQARYMKFAALSLIEQDAEFRLDSQTGLVDWARR